MYVKLSETKQKAEVISNSGFSWDQTKSFGFLFIFWMEQLLETVYYKQLRIWLVGLFLEFM